MNVADVMTSELSACLPSEPLMRAARIMWEQDCGCVPVVDGDAKPVGMITDRDVCMAAYTTAGRLDDYPVERAMARPAWSCRPTDPLAAAHELMRLHQVRRLLVTDDEGRLVGLLALSDLTQRALPRADAKERTGQMAELVETLGEVTRPRRSLKYRAACLLTST